MTLQIDGPPLRGWGHIVNVVMKKLNPSMNTMGYYQASCTTFGGAPIYLK